MFSKFAMLYKHTMQGICDISALYPFWSCVQLTVLKWLPIFYTQTSIPLVVGQSNYKLELWQWGERKGENSINHSHRCRCPFVLISNLKVCHLNDLYRARRYYKSVKPRGYTEDTIKQARGKKHPKVGKKTQKTKQDKKKKKISKSC